MTKQIITTLNAPKPIGTYSQATVFGDLIFTSGQIGLDHRTMELEEGFSMQATKAIHNIKAIALEAHCKLSDIVKLTVFVTDMGDFPEFNKIMGELFEPPFPARSVIGVSQLPLDALVEVEAVLLKSKSDDTV